TQNARRTAAHERRRGLFEGQEPGLPCRTEGVTPQAAITLHDAMAGDNDRHRVFMQRIANGSRRTRATDALGEPLAGAYFRIWNRGGRRQDIALKRCTVV